MVWSVTGVIFAYFIAALSMINTIFVTIDMAL